MFEHLHTYTYQNITDTTLRLSQLSVDLQIGSMYTFITYY